MVKWIVAVIAVLILIFWVASALPSLLNALDRGKQQRTVEHLESTNSAILEYQASTGQLPDAPDVDTCNEILGASFSPVDGWGNGLYLRSGPGEFVLISYGKDGIADVADPTNYEPGPTYDFRADIVLRDGQFVRYPAR